MPPFFFVFLHQNHRCGFVCVSHRRRTPNHPLPSHHRHDRLLHPWLLFLSDPPSTFLLSLSSTSDLPCSLFFLYCRSLPTGAAMAGFVVMLTESLRSSSPPCFPLRSIGPWDPWRLCTIIQLEEVKCVLRLIPIWMTIIFYSVIFTQMASLFIKQGDAMNTTIVGFKIPPASMSAFDILNVMFFILFYCQLLTPVVSRLRKDPKGLTELQHMGIGLCWKLI